jgi:hypothetical protein
MKRKRPGMLSVRSVNEYRRRDTLAYLALRYYLETKSASTDLWATEVAIPLVLSRTKPSYFNAFHFKEKSEQSGVEHRSIHLPSASEALAEAALLAECAQRPNAFSNLPVVFSYALNADGTRKGLFAHYIHGLRNRHERIASACEDCPNGIVRYVDIKRFYPSIPIALAKRAWQERCDVGRLPNVFRELGEKLIADHGAIQRTEGEGILTGPMFSHILGNLVLRKIDEEFSANSTVQYCRYVDDITFVGEHHAVARAVFALRSRLQDIGFELHDDDSPKSISIPAAGWLNGRDDFSESGYRPSWPALVGDLKRFLLVNTEQHEQLQTAFRSESLRIPVRDYSAVVREQSFLEHLARYAPVQWFKTEVRALTIESLTVDARALRQQAEDEFNKLLEGAADLTGYERKRRIPQLRRRAGRLIYLAEDAALLRLASFAAEFPELYLHAEVMKAVASGEIDGLLSMGTNAAQAAAQPLRAAGKQCSVTKPVDTEIKRQSLADFLFNGVPISSPADSTPSLSEIVRFASSGSDAALMRSDDGFIREIACLAGVGARPRHADMLWGAFDEDEELALDAVEQIHQSASP